LHRAADLAAGGKMDELLGLIAEPLIPRGWLARLPEPTPVGVALDTLNKLIGPPASSLKRSPTAVEEAMAKAAAATATAFALDLQNLLPVLVDDPQFRLAGTEELYRQFLATTDRLIERFTQSAIELDARAVAGYECLTQFAHFQKGMRKPTAAELADALRQYPRARFQAVTFRQLVALYQSVREALGGQLADVALARQRLAALATAVCDEAAEEPPGAFRKLMPPGCATVGEAVDRFIKVLTDADLTVIDRRVQAALEPEAGGLLGVCLNSAMGVAGVATIVFEEARSHLDQRLGEVGLTAMFGERFRTPQQAERAIEQAYQEAEPAWVGTGPWAGAEVTVLACPGGPSGEPLREVARRAISVAGLTVADSRDDLTVYREWPRVPLAALPHLGPAAAAAYQALPETSQCSPHARTDVTLWFDVDAD
jgi:eukaryotic-like serine/threonine-protein kinase